MVGASEQVFERHPTLADHFSGLQPGVCIRLLLTEYLPAGGSALFPVEYVHRTMEYRTSGMKDAVAHGQARLVDAGNQDFRDARILFSRHNDTATLKGLALEGQLTLA